MILIVLLYALFASSFTMGKVLVQYTTPFFLTGARMLTGGIILLAYQYLWWNNQFRFKKKHFWLYAQIILLGIVFTYTLRFWALEYLPSSKTCFLYNLSPFLSSFYSYIFFNERMTKKQWVGLFIGFIGLIPILITSSPAETTMGEMLYISWPELAILCSVAAHSYSWIVVRKLVRDKNYTPMMVNGVTMACGGFIALMGSAAFETERLVPGSTLVVAGWLAAVILISNIICYNLYGYLLREYTATFLSFAGFLSPMFAALYGRLFLGEIITWHFYLSSTIVFAGLCLFYQDELGNKKSRWHTT